MTRPKKSKRGRPKINSDMRRVTVELPEDVCRQLDAEAKRQGLHFSHVMRIWLRQRMETGVGS